MASEILKVSANFLRNETFYVLKKDLAGRIKFDSMVWRVIYLKSYTTFYVLKKNLAGLKILIKFLGE